MVRSILLPTKVKLWQQDRIMRTIMLPKLTQQDHDVINFLIHRRKEGVWSSSAPVPVHRRKEGFKHRRGKKFCPCASSRPPR